MECKLWWWARRQPRRSPGAAPRPRRTALRSRSVRQPRRAIVSDPGQPADPRLPPSGLAIARDIGAPREETRASKESAAGTWRTSRPRRHQPPAAGTDRPPAHRHAGRPAHRHFPLSAWLLTCADPLDRRLVPGAAVCRRVREAGRAEPPASLPAWLRSRRHPVLPGTGSARQAPRPRHGDYPVSLSMEVLDQLSPAQHSQRPAHRHAGKRVLAGKLILGWQGRAKRIGPLSDTRG